MKVLSAGIVPVRLAGGEPEFLCLRAYRNWDFPKGVVEKGEEPLAAALRELREETGLTGAKFPWGKEFVETGPYARGKVARFYLAELPVAEVTLAVNPALGRPEHTEYRWLPHAEARRLLVPRLQRVIDWAAGKISPG